MVWKSLSSKVFVLFCLLNILRIRVCSGQIVECESIKGVKGIGLVGGNKCFIYISKGPPLNQKTAKQICEGQGFTIAELTSQLESVAVSVHLRSYVNSNEQNKVRYFFTGGEESAAGDFQYIDGRYLKVQGCFRVNFQKFIMSGKDVTPETCMQDCKRQGYRYASIKELGNDPNYFSDCYCDNTLDRSSSSRCSKRCTKYSGTDLEKFYFCGSGSNRDISTVYHTDGIFSIFDESQPSWNPNLPNDAHNCIVLKDYSQRYDDQDCFKKGHGALCQFKGLSANECQKDNSLNWIEGVNQCIGFNTKPFNNWFDARNGCYTKGGDLIVIDSIDFYNAVAELHETTKQGYFFWIGASNRQYTWSITKKPIIFSHFYTDHRFSTSRNCFVVDTSFGFVSPGYYPWTDVDCDTFSPDNGVLCMEIKSETTTQKPTTKLTTKVTTKETTKSPLKSTPSTTKKDSQQTKPTEKPIETAKPPSTKTAPTVKINSSVETTPSKSTSQPKYLQPEKIKDSADLELDIGVIIVICLVIAAIIGGVMRILAYILIAKTTNEEKCIENSSTLEMTDRTNNVNYFQNQIVQNGNDTDKQGMKNEQFNY